MLFSRPRPPQNAPETSRGGPEAPDDIHAEFDPAKIIKNITFSPWPSPGPPPKRGGSAREIPRTPSDNPIEFPYSLRRSPWRAHSSPHGLPGRPRAPPMAKKIIKTNVFLTFSKTLKTVLGSLRGRPEPPRGALGDQKKERAALRTPPRTPLGSLIKSSCLM